MSQPGDGTNNRIDASSAHVVIQGRDINIGSLSPAVPLPRQLPAPTLYFTDREEPLRRLERARERAVRAGVPLVVVLTGPGGIGKSELAYQWLKTLGKDAEGPHFWDDMALGGARTADDVVRGFLRALGVPAADIPRAFPEMVGHFRTRTSEKPALVLLENVTVAAQVRSLLPAAPGSVLAVTARDPLPNLPGAVEVPVPPLAGDAARSLLRDLAGADDPAFDALAELCAGRPLSLCAAGSRLASRPAADVAREIRRSAPAAPDAVAAVLSTGYEELPEPSAALYRALGVLFGAEVTIETAAALTGAADPVPLLDDLRRAGLITEVGAGRYRLHELARDHARALAAPAERDAALRRLLGWYLHRAAVADHALMPGRWRLGPAFAPLLGRPPEIDPDAAGAWLEGHRAELRAAVQAAADHGWADLAVQLVEAQWALCFQRKHYEHWLDTHRRAAAVAPHASDPRFEGRVRCQLGFAYLELDRPDDAAAAFTAARAADRAAGHARGEATAVESLGLLQLRRCGAEEPPALAATRPDLAAEALDLLTDNLRLNLAMSEAADDDRAVALAWRHRGRALGATGDHDAAVAHLRRAHDLLTALGDTYNAGKALGDLGQAQVRAGRSDEARAALDAALELLPAERHAAERATVLETLSALAERDGDRAAAVAALEAALELLAGKPRADAVRARLDGLRG
ncbi:Regulatory protein AfsR [Actinomadura rubteroloni]|uniref:Regulatory protein AfsR n=1 Tax=Actinomadura rubteroloni TaxID=1926885 RepID=A0A2P4UD34_9ACTN|nr:tetratricopeptide repeat protein [Actinomadura rubteroloni]POM22965.1 Regulatory protein AfsR [Actinomadura rubteroloni]